LMTNFRALKIKESDAFLNALKIFEFL